MMFERFKELFASESLLDAAYETTFTMLEDCQDMYHSSRHSLRATGTNDLPFDIRKMDRKINKYQREVRRQVLTHLAISGTSNLAPGLGLVSIVIDVERIGDYTKNISDLAIRHKQQLDGGRHEEDLRKVEKIIEESFPDAIAALKDQNADRGRAVMTREVGIGKMCDDIMYNIVEKKEDPEFKSGDAVVLALYARYLKRINAHLTNIASSIVNPFPRIGFREKIKKKS